MFNGKNTANAAQFTATHWSVVLTANQKSPEARLALEQLCQTYWYPLYAFVRRRGHDSHEAKDLTQGFFAHLLSNDFLKDVSAAKGKFRSFLLASLNHYLSNERDRAMAAKRGGGMAIASLDDTSGEDRYQIEPVSETTPEVLFDQRWAGVVLNQAFARVREQFQRAGKISQFDGLKAFLQGDAEEGDYSALAEKLGMTSGAIAVAVHRLRHDFREAIREEVAQTVANPTDVEEEMRHLFLILTQQ